VTSVAVKTILICDDEPHLREAEHPRQQWPDDVDGLDAPQRHAHRLTADETGFDLQLGAGDPPAGDEPGHDTGQCGDADRGEVEPCALVLARCELPRPEHCGERGETAGRPQQRRQCMKARPVRGQ